MATISKDVADITLTCMSPSKTFNLAGLCISSVIVSNLKMLRQFNIAAENAAIETTNVFGIVASEAAYRYGEDWLEQLLAYVQGNVDFLLDYFKIRIASIKPVTPEGTYLVWLDCRDLGMNPTNLRQFMIKKAKVGLNDGSTFGLGGEGFQRINLACSRANLEEALKRIENAVKNLPDSTKAKKTNH
jgi:cystathionine beta-lyase